MAAGTTKNGKTQAETGAEVAVSNVSFSADEMRELATFEDVQALFEAHGVTVVNAAEEIGDGFVLLSKDDKPKFEGVAMMLLSWVFAEGDHKKEDGTKGEFVAVRFVTREMNGTIGKYILTDGGTGIYEQLKSYSVRSGNKQAMYVPKGLRVSRYSNEYSDDNVTCYLDLSA